MPIRAYTLADVVGVLVDQSTGAGMTSAVGATEPFNILLDPSDAASVSDVVSWTVPTTQTWDQGAWGWLTWG